jgi:hypothetical protein
MLNSILYCLLFQQGPLCETLRCKVACCAGEQAAEQAFRFCRACGAGSALRDPAGTKKVYVVSVQFGLAYGFGRADRLDVTSRLCAAANVFRLAPGYESITYLW